MILLYMPTIFDNSLLIKAINDEYREFENAVEKKKNSEIQGEKYIKPIFTAKEKKKVKIYFKLITEIISKEGNWKKGYTIL